jgi:hypothetical protein
MGPATPTRTSTTLNGAPTDGRPPPRVSGTARLDQAVHLRWPGTSAEEADESQEPQEPQEPGRETQKVKYRDLVVGEWYLLSHRRIPDPL